MIAYLDASVVLRLVLGELEALAAWPQVVRALASTLTEGECLRTLDRLVRRGSLPEPQIAERPADETTCDALQAAHALLYHRVFFNA